MIMAHTEKYLESLNIARELASENGGVLPNVGWLIDNGHQDIIKAIREDRRPFEAMLAKRGRGRDKNKYAYVEANMDVPNDVLARDLDLSKTTIVNWKAEIRESSFVDPAMDDVPDDVSADELTKFAVRGLPPGWRLDVSYSHGGCYVTLVQPNGADRGLSSVYGAGVVHSVVAHVNYARKKSGLEPVAWGE